MSTSTIEVPPVLREFAPTPDSTPAPIHLGQKVLTALLVAGPILGVAALIPLLWGRAIDPSDVIMASVLYALTGLGMTVGFHRLFTHRSFKATRSLRIVLAILGSMAIEGSVTGWVAAHRRHHVHSDREGDPHSPYRYGDHGWPLVRGLIYSHVGWLFANDPTSAERYAPDLLRDRDLDTIGRFFPWLAVFSLALPFGLGYGLSGTFEGAMTAFIWAGLARMALLHHVTWSVNSLCHTFGRQSEPSVDRSTNLWPLAVLSFGESWHNIHHAHPTWARHGARRGMVDPSARVIKLLETLGWVTAVRWPSASSP